MRSMGENILYYGDNLDILRRYVADESVDLIYLDPPFKSKKDYNVLFIEQDGSKSKAQIKAFEDTWQWDQEAAALYQEVVEAGGKVSQTMQGFRLVLGQNDMLAYLTMMAPRLIELRRVLKDTGSIYLHCDQTASHYLKMLMDAVFGPTNFKNEIIWHYKKWPSGKYAFQRNHDIILFYARSASRERTFNQLFMERAPSTLKRFGAARIVSGYDEMGRRLPAKTEVEDSEGVRQDDVWEIGRVPPIKQLFPTQKPETLLERIILASSNEDDIVLDPFCGCGTTITVAELLKRNWIAIDITHLAITLIKKRLLDTFGEQIKYQIIGEPVSLPDAEVLARQNPYQFQYWALGLVGARPVEEKKGADKGIDGRLYFHDAGKGGKTKQIVISVKSGHVSVSQIRDLRGVIEREQAEIGVFVCLHEPTKAMRSEAAGAGFYDSPWGSRHPRLQIITIVELLSGRGINYPPSKQVNVTFKKASKGKINNNPDNTLKFSFTDED